MCIFERSGGVIQATHSIAADATVVSHEMGHNLGMIHDGDQSNGLDARGCSSNSFIMGPSANLGNPATVFSSCSKSAVRGLFDDTGLTCLTNEPPAEGGECGDGILNIGEDCDCGQDDCSDIDPCCHGSTCEGVTGNACQDSDGINGTAIVVDV